MDAMRRTRTSSVHQRRHLLAAAGAEFDDGGNTGAGQNRAAVGGEQPRLRASDAIPGQSADRLEERRPQIVVEIARRKLPRLERQVVIYVGRELFNGNGAFADSRDHRAHRNVAYTYG